jgi:hypothetical protein
LDFKSLEYKDLPPKKLKWAHRKNALKLGFTRLRDLELTSGAA